MSQSSIPLRQKVLVLLEILGNRAYVLIFDNFEDVLNTEGAVSDRELDEFLSLIASEKHSLRVVLTTREKLQLKTGTANARVRNLPIEKGLPDDEAIALLSDLEERTGVDCGFAEVGREILLRAVHAVKGIPKGIEYIHSILMKDETLSLEQLLDSTSLFEGEVLDNLTEFQYNHLSEQERRVLMALSVFDKPVPAVAVQFILLPFYPDLDAGTALKTLVRNSILLTRRGNDTFELHPRDQQYAYKQLPETGKPGEFTRVNLHTRAADVGGAKLNPPSRITDYDIECNGGFRFSHLQREK
ncbi:MAG: hypothetical protein DRI57_33040 [Deltaproteobacteria bacterium]|nr:MAG: hypothetical protein DRI57_33040 [Deltaproteobacteria bacterium]